MKNFVAKEVGIDSISCSGKSAKKIEGVAGGTWKDSTGGIENDEEEDKELDSESESELSKSETFALLGGV